MIVAIQVPRNEKTDPFLLFYLLLVPRLATIVTASFKAVGIGEYLTATTENVTHIGTEVAHTSAC